MRLFFSLQQQSSPASSWLVPHLSFQMTLSV